MGCKNKYCPRNLMDEKELLMETINELRTINPPEEITKQMDAQLRCTKCSMLKVADWLGEFMIMKYGSENN